MTHPAQPDYRWHTAAFYRDDAEYLRLATTFLGDAVRADSPVLVLAPPAQLSMVRRTALGGHPLVTYDDMPTLGGNPGRIIGFIRQFAEVNGGRARVLSEPVWPGRPAAELAECHRHEALINVALHPEPVLCPYSVRNLPAEVLAEARRTHQVIAEGDDRTDSTDFTDPLQAARSIQPALPPPTADVVSLVVSRDRLAAMRSTVDRFAAASGLPAARRADLVLAASEATSNSLYHSPGPGLLRLWREPGTVILEVSDSGHIADPLVGRRPPPPLQARGRGLWLIHQVSDLTQIRSGADRTVVRITMRRAA